jgi:SAM-dependent methyltransferase
MLEADLNYASADPHTLVLKLRKALPDINVTELSLAAETFVARRAAPAKLGAWAKAGFFSTALLEQASRESIAHYRAHYFTGCSHVLEVGTGTGSDTAALARVVAHVTTIDGDPVASEVARRNLALQGVTNVTFLVGDAQTVIPTLAPHFDGFFADPARRSKEGARFKDADDYSPPLHFVLSLNLGAVRAVKVSPGLFIDAPSGWVRQFVGFQSECLEQTLWYGTKVADSSVAITDSKAFWAPSINSASRGFLTQLPNAIVGSYLLEAHAAVNRSQHVQQFFCELQGTMIAPDIAYAVSATEPPRSALVKAYRVIDCVPFSIKGLKSTLQSLGWSNRTELKKRNFPLELERVRADLKLPSHSHNAPFGVLFFFKHAAQSWVVLADRCSETL